MHRSLKMPATNAPGTGSQRHNGVGSRQCRLDRAGSLLRMPLSGPLSVRFRAFLLQGPSRLAPRGREPKVFCLPLSLSSLDKEAEKDCALSLSLSLSRFCSLRPCGTTTRITGPKWSDSGIALQPGPKSAVSTAEPYGALGARGSSVASGP